MADGDATVNLLIEDSPLPDLPALLSAMHVDGRTFSWYLANIEASAWPQAIGDGWLTGVELMSTWMPGETQFVWGVLDAFPLGQTFDVLDPPWADGNASLWARERLRPQIEGALFEIVYFDASAVILIGLTDEWGALVSRAYPVAKRLP